MGRHMGMQTAHTLVPPALPVPLTDTPQHPWPCQEASSPWTAGEGPTSAPSPSAPHLPGQEGQEQAEKGSQDDADDDGQ